MDMAERSTQLLAREAIAPTDKVKALNESIDGLYTHWNHYDIIPDVADLLRRRSDAVCAQNLVRDSIEALSEAIVYDPFSGVNFSMRGRRYINVGDFAQACADFAMASRLIPENWYVWYHLGLCNLLLGQYEMAERAYLSCAQIPTTLSLTIALKNWMWITYMRQGKRDKAAALLEDVRPGMDMDGTDNYLRMLLLYKGELSPEAAMAVPEGDEEPILSVTTQGFGVANYYLLAKEDTRMYEQTLDDTLRLGREEAWMCFGYAASAFEKNRLERERNG